MIQTGFRFKNVIDFVKEYLSVILILPAIFGGLWQLFELWSISPSFIRFFSISQIVPDGLFILFIILYCSLPLLGTQFIWSTTFQTDKTLYEVVTVPIIARKRQKVRFYGFVFLIVWLLSCVFFWYFSYINIQVLKIHWGIIIGLFVILLCNLYLNNCFKYSIPNDKQFYKHGNLLLLILYFFIISFIFKKVHRNQFPTINVGNIDNVISNVNKEYPDSKNEVLYFNDKFIFFKFTDKKINDKVTKEPLEKIHIVKLESLFND